DPVPPLAGRCGLAALLCLPAGGAAGPAQALAAPQASLQIAARPDRLGARTALTVALEVFGEGAQDGVPPPLRTLTIHLPSGLGVSLAGVATCRPSALRRRGIAACPATARVGAGDATLEVHAGSQTIPEDSRLTAF